MGINRPNKKWSIIMGNMPTFWFHVAQVVIGIVILGVVGMVMGASGRFRK